jgi:hypothetical protein
MPKMDGDRNQRSGHLTFADSIGVGSLIVGIVVVIITPRWWMKLSLLVLRARILGTKWAPEVAEVAEVKQVA